MMSSPLEVCVNVASIPPLDTYEQRKQFALAMLAAAPHMGSMRHDQAIYLSHGIINGLLAVMCRIETTDPPVIVVTLTHTESTVYV